MHNGHLSAARQLLEAANLHEAWLVPNARPPHRIDPPVAAAGDRMRMVELAVSRQPGLQPSRVEVDRGGVSYTIDTLRSLKSQFPSRRFILLLGSDAALQIGGWHEAGALLAEASFVIFDRPQTSLLPQTIHDLGFAPERTRIVHIETPDISAHQVRDRLARGVPIDDLVPPAVADYIAEHRLYRPPAQLG